MVFLQNWSDDLPPECVCVSDLFGLPEENWNVTNYLMNNIVCRAAHGFSLSVKHAESCYHAGTSCLEDLFYDRVKTTYF